MKYELAKKLEDAGFGKNRAILHGKRIVFSDSHIDSEGNLITSADAVEVPTLSELIEACGDGFDALLKGQRKNNVYGLWRADASDEAHGISLTGSTPEEAVANLWLALNKK